MRPARTTSPVLLLATLLALPFTTLCVADAPRSAKEAPDAQSLDSRWFHETQSLLFASFRVVESARFVILTDADDDWVSEQCRTLEATHDEFDRFIARVGLEANPPAEKMVCVMFDSRAAYRDFAIEHDGVHDPTIAGYYSPASRRLVVYHPGDAPAASELRARVARGVAELKSLRADIKGFGEDLAKHDRAIDIVERRLQRDDAALRDFVSRISAATVIHEAVHMLAFHSHLQSPSVQYPLWVSEGLATAFEAERTDRRFGPDVESKSRRAAFEELLRRDRLLPLESLAAITMLESRGSDESRIVYQQGAALIAWLVQFRRVEFGSYLAAMRNERDGRPTPSRHLAILEASFGDIAALEGDWLRWEKARAGLAVGDVSPKPDRVSNVPAVSPRDLHPE